MADKLSDGKGGPADVMKENDDTTKPFETGDRAEVVFYTSEGEEMVYQGVVQESHHAQVVKINHEWFLADREGNYTRLPSITNKGTPAIARRSDAVVTFTESEIAAQGARQRRNKPRPIVATPDTATDGGWAPRQSHPRRSGARGPGR